MENIKFIDFHFVMLYVNRFDLLIFYKKSNKSLCRRLEYHRKYNTAKLFS